MPRSQDPVLQELLQLTGMQSDPFYRSGPKEVQVMLKPDLMGFVLFFPMFILFPESVTGNRSWPIFTRV